MKNKNSQTPQNQITTDRKDRLNLFVVQIIMGAINLFLLFISLMMVVIFSNDLLHPAVIIATSFYGFYLLVNTVFCLFFYFYFNSVINSKEKQYFLVCIFLAPFGLNLFTSIHFYLHSGMSKKKIQEAIFVIKKNRIKEIIRQKAVYTKLQKDDLSKMDILFQIVADGYDTADNVNAYILDLLISKGINTDIKIHDDEVIAVGKYL